MDILSCTPEKLAEAWPRSSAGDGVVKRVV